MRILNLHATNVKKLKVVDITPTEALVQITGKNGSGKSSVLDAILYALAGTRHIATEPVRRGARKAVIKLDLGELVVTRRMHAAGGGSLTVEAKDGTPLRSPQGVLDKLFGDLTFDPLAFAMAEPKHQLEMLRALVHVDTDLDALDEAYRVDFEARTAVSAQMKALSARLSALPTPPADLPDAAIDVDALLLQMEQASARNSEIAAMQATEDAVENRVLHLTASVSELARALDEAREELRQAQATWEARPKIPAHVDVADLRERIQGARAINRAIEERGERDKMKRQVVDLANDVDRLTDRLEAGKDEKAAAIARADMPVPGLGFGEGVVLYNGLPFDQASSAEQLRVSVAMAMKANPELRVLRIKDGSLLDDDNLALIAAMATADDYQVWIERVETSGVGVVMEDGAVAGAAADAPEDSDATPAGE